MYKLPYHKAANQAEINQLIATFPFALINGVNASQQVEATQVPLFLEQKNGKTYLSGHIMRNTDHHKAFQSNAEVLAIFTSPHCYVSGSWYSNPHTPSTWNYMSVHARGKINFLKAEDLIRMLQKTSLHFENQNPDSPTVFEHLSPTLVKRLMPAIVAFEIEVESFDSVFKLSQDRDKESYLNIIEELKKQGSNEQFIAHEMEKRISTLFPTQA